ncbi:hypothetical protein SAMN05216497_101255 [Clostridium cochlearium]|uniref:Surface/cell-adhesion protein n=1 Tax=Clostridium cochlearium TaxID=1494 RepID=A0ABY0QIB3_CLOCO|nr:hypothetical protein [Clostridium cochlearium]SDK85206.1 hypothetical protein SAMN05216497_101255 [Clostridium cochlearium]
MYKKRQYKNFICVLVVVLMLLTIGDVGILERGTVFAKTNKKDDKIAVKSEENLNENNIMSLKEIRDIINKIQSENIGISSIRIVNNLEGIEPGDEIQFEVQDELGQQIPVDNLVFTVNNEELGKMDENIINKFTKLGSDTVVIKVTLKDRPNIKDEIRI